MDVVQVVAVVVDELGDVVVEARLGRLEGGAAPVRVGATVGLGPDESISVTASSVMKALIMTTRIIAMPSSRVRAVSEGRRLIRAPTSGSRS